jgi:hypothetical protein
MIILKGLGLIGVQDFHSDLFVWKKRTERVGPTALKL